MVAESGRMTPMGLVARLGKLRSEQIERKAEPFLDEGEEIVSWVRARDPEDGGKGIFFLTEKRALVTWSGRGEGPEDLPWEQVRTWGLNQESKDGPVVCVQTHDDSTTFVQIAVSTREMAKVASSFIRSFAEFAPWPEGNAIQGANGSFEARSETEVHHSHRTPRQMAKRVGLTVLGAGLIIVGIAIIPLPGPWSFLLNIAGLAVLSREYDWAEDLLEWTKDRFEAAKKRVTGRRKRKSSSSESS